MCVCVCVSVCACARARTIYNEYTYLNQVFIFISFILFQSFNSLFFLDKLQLMLFVHSSDAVTSLRPIFFVHVPEIKIKCFLHNF